VTHVVYVDEHTPESKSENRKQRKNEMSAAVGSLNEMMSNPKFFNPMMGSFECNEEIDLVYFVESEPGHMVKMKETFHVTSIPCDRWSIFFSFEWMKKTGIWLFYDRNRRSGTLEEESAFKKEGMDRFRYFGAMGGLKKKDLTVKELVDEVRLEEHLVLEKEMLPERKE